MKLKIYRQSGDPVELANRELYKAEWQLFYDRAAERAALDMLKLQRMLRFGERLLVRKHNVEVVIEVPKSQKAWTTLIAKYEDTPFMIARTADGEGLVGVIMDALQ